MLLRDAARTLDRIADLLELRGESRIKSATYRNAARALTAGRSADPHAPLSPDALAGVRGVAPAMRAVLDELAATGASSLLDQLSEDTPEGLLEMLRIPGLGTTKIRAIHLGLDIESVPELEAAARDGRLAALPRFGAKTAAKIRRGIADLREASEFVLYAHARAEGERLLEAIRRVPGVARAEMAGSLRRRAPVVRDIDIVAACTRSPEEVAAEVARAPGVQDVIGLGSASVALRYEGGTRLDLHCVPPAGFPFTLWRATGSASHVRELETRVHGLADAVARAAGARDTIADPEGDALVYAAARLPLIAPELREGLGEIDAAAEGRLPTLITPADIRGALHCHSDYSDGEDRIAPLAAAARDRGWRYLGFSDHSQSAAYSGGLTHDAVLRQHAEIDRVQGEFGDFRLLKGIEADILADGRVDYDEALIDRFDYVIASIHARYGMDERAMTDRVLRALEDPHVTILGHPTGRLLLTREPYAIDMPAVLERAAELGVAVELNADPHRLDLDWTLCRVAKAAGCTVEIGPDAHSAAGLDNMSLGVGIARKGWLEAGDVLNARPVAAVLEHARGRRALR